MTEEFKGMEEMTEKAFGEVPRIIDINFNNKFNLRFNRTPVGYMCLMTEEMLNTLQDVINKEFDHE